MLTKTPTIPLFLACARKPTPIRSPGSEFLAPVSLWYWLPFFSFVSIAAAIFVSFSGFSRLFEVVFFSCRYLSPPHHLPAVVALCKGWAPWPQRLSVSLGSSVPGACSDGGLVSMPPSRLPFWVSSTPGARFGRLLSSPDYFLWSTTSFDYRLRLPLIRKAWSCFPTRGVILAVSFPHTHVRTPPSRLPNSASRHNLWWSPLAPSLLDWLVLLVSWHPVSSLFLGLLVSVRTATGFFDWPFRSAGQLLPLPLPLLPFLRPLAFSVALVRLGITLFRFR